MKQLGSSFYLVLLLTIAYLFIGSWYWPCQVKGLCDTSASPAQPINTPKASAPITYFSHPFQLMEDGKPLLEAREGIRFAKNSELPVFGAAIGEKIVELSDLLKNQPQKDLVITGIYSPDDQLAEGNAISNMGLARAINFKQFLLDKGIPLNRFISLYERSSDPYLYNESDTLDGGIRLSLVSRSSTGESMENPMAEPFSVHFETGSSYVQLDSVLRSAITRTIQYLNGQPESFLALVGHTDNEGEASNNLVLGLDRANDLAKTFRDFGLTGDQIQTSSQGEEKPVATNETEEGRAQNRRVEMRISSKN